MRVVAVETEIFEFEGKNVVDRRIDPDRRQRPGFTGKLEFCLVKMIRINVRVAKSMHKLARLVAADLGQHERQQGVGGDIEGHAEKC